MAKIITDVPAENAFDEYATALSNIITGSNSPFTIGILGEWGVGKTSLMENISSKLKCKKSNPPVVVWFDAWRCQQEKTFALIPLLGTIIYAIKKDRKLKKIMSDFLNSIELKFGLEGNMGPLKAILGRKTPKLIESQYYDSLKKIEDNLNGKKIVVFIDDLDRCRPDKIIEIIESLKVFLDIQGFVYVMALSPSFVEKAIEEKYKNLGINGKNYLEKIIQIPIMLPEWNEINLKKYLEKIIDERDEEYSTLKEHMDIILETITGTPRDIKRFMNTYICEHEFLEKEAKKDKGEMEEHLILTILKFKWSDYYNYVLREENLKELKIYLNSRKEDKEKKIGLFNEFDDKKKLVNFLEKEKVKKIINKIEGKELLEYETIGKIIPKEIKNTTLYEPFANFMSANLEGANLEGANLEGANLFDANLIGANLKRANLKRANLKRANLFDANLIGANLKRANLKRANLDDANLMSANLMGANLEDANLLDANLEDANLLDANLEDANLIGANLEDANLMGAIILNIKPNYSHMRVKNTNFEDALINNKSFLTYLKKRGAINVPDAIENKNEIIKILKKRNYPHLEQIKEFLK